MKKIIFSAILILALSLAINGCSNGAGAKITSTTQLNETNAGSVVGTVPIEQVKATIKEVYGISFKDYKYFDTFGAAISALKSDQIDTVYTTEFTAKYIVDKNPDLSYVNDGIKKLPHSVHMAYRKTDTALGDEINAALAELKANGTLDALKEKYVTNLSSDTQQAGTKFDGIPGAKTVYVGISGDFAPLDYTAADGSPAGYSLEVLSLLSKKLNVNFEIVSLHNDAKYIALLSNKIDIFFLDIIIGSVPVMEESNTPEIAYSDAYYEYDLSAFIVKK